MAKEKKRDAVKKPKSISVEAEVALLGLLLSIASLIGLLNQGWLGSFLTYCLVYLFGSMYFVILLLNIYVGVYLFFKKKKPKVVLGLNGVAIIFLLFFLLVASSKFDGANLSSWFKYFSNNLNKVTISSFKVNLSKINLVGGGLVGYGAYTLLVSMVGTFVSEIIIVLIIVGCLYILLKKPIMEIIRRAKVFIKKRKEKSKSNEDVEQVEEKNIVNEVDNKENEKKIIDTVEDFKIDEELSFETGNNDNSKLTFDIFNELIFEDEVSDIVDDQPLVVEDDIVVSEEIKYDGLEFFGEEELVKDDKIEKNIEEKPVNDVFDIPVVEEKVNPNIPSNPFVEEEVKTEKVVISTAKKDFKEIDDVYSLLKENNENNAYAELRDEVEINCEKINHKLNELNIKASVNDYIIGPCVTRYEIVPEIGVRVSSIVNIENDLKLALAAVKTRMEAPIPGKSAVGIEVANKKRYPVYLKEVITPYKDDNSKLLVGIGRDLNNKEVVINIDKMPHLLVAGATGSGKSVCINSIIVSLLLRTTPDEVKLILIDPKKVEMLPYANMPHLLCPVVIDPKKASMALKKVVKEMDRRYDEFANNGVRNIDGYNKLKKENGEQPLCNIVVIIDELADLMLVAAKEVEESIQRITQLARAAGIYLIVATQRPSVDVITGVIKANIPSRIAFSVSSQIDSRTIIDRGGAEELLGKGDMLMDISGSGTLSRVQGVFVSDEEIFNVVKYVKSKFNTNFDEEFLNLEEEKKEEINNLLINDDTNNDDKLYEDIKDFVIRNQKASTSLLQRYFTLGYARAARMVDRLESDGIISGANGAKPREVLVNYNNKENDTNE